MLNSVHSLEKSSDDWQMRRMWKHALEGNEAGQHEMRRRNRLGSTERALQALQVPAGLIACMTEVEHGRVAVMQPVEAEQIRFVAPATHNTSPMLAAERVQPLQPQLLPQPLPLLLQLPPLQRLQSVLNLHRHRQHHSRYGCDRFRNHTRCPYPDPLRRHHRPCLLLYYVVDMTLVA